MYFSQKQDQIRVMIGKTLKFKTLINIGDFFM